jgi:hypothetical protein
LAGITRAINGVAKTPVVPPNPPFDRPIKQITTAVVPKNMIKLSVTVDEVP